MATGYAAGLAAKGFAESADGIEALMRATAEGVEDAASILATFRSVLGERKGFQPSRGRMNSLSANAGACDSRGACRAT
jgi:hypothetical protein